MKSNKKSIQMVVADNHSLELKNNFDWDNTKLNRKVCYYINIILNL